VTTSGREASFDAPQTAWRDRPVAGPLTFVASARHRGGGYIARQVQAPISSVETMTMQVPPTWRAGVPVDLQWTPQGTVDAVYAQARLRIRLSADGGRTFDRVLAADVANTGTVRVCVPVGVAGGAARLRIEARDGGFHVDSPAFSVAPPAGGATCPAP
jgi:hypothetical protein